MMEAEPVTAKLGSAVEALVGAARDAEATWGRRRRWLAGGGDGRNRSEGDAGGGGRR